MIKCDKGQIEVRGLPPIITSELSIILRHCYRNFVEIMGEDDAKQIIVRIGKLAFMSDEELKETSEKLGSNEIIDKAIDEVLKEVLDD